MQSYRIYFFNENGHIASTRDLSCLSDADALSQAARLRHPHLVELWERGRLVGRFERAWRQGADQHA